jgi:hypothetical protein
VANGFCKQNIYTDGMPLLILKFSFGFCDGDAESKERIGGLPFSDESWNVIEDKLALPRQFIPCMIQQASPSFKVSTPKHSGRSITCKFLLALKEAET